MVGVVRLTLLFCIDTRQRRVAIFTSQRRFRKFYQAAPGRVLLFSYANSCVLSALIPDSAAADMAQATGSCLLLNTQPQLDTDTAPKWLLSELLTAGYQSSFL